MTMAQLLSCSLNILLGDVPVAIDVMAGLLKFPEPG